MEPGTISTGNISGKVIIINGNHNSITLIDNDAILERNANIEAPVTVAFQGSTGDVPELRHLIGREEELKLLTSLYLDLNQNKKGGLVFILSKPGYGGKALGRTFIDAVSKGGGITAITRFWQQDVQRHTHKDPRWSILMEKYNAIFEEGPALLLQDTFLPFLPLIAQIYARKKLFLDISFLPTGTRQIPGFIRSLVKDGKPVVVFLEDFENADIAWIDLLRYLATECNRDLPVLFIVTLHVDEPLEQKPAELLFPCQAFVLDLERKGEGRIIYLERLSQNDIASFISPASTDLAKKLFSLSAGIPLLVESLWQIWVDDGCIRKSTAGQWDFISGTRWRWLATGRDYINQIMDEQWYENESEAPWSKERMLEMLACAAQEGITFTLDALAYAYEVDIKTLEDELLGFLDDPSDPGLVVAVAPPEPLCISGNKPFKKLQHYRFQPLIVWEYFANECSVDPHRMLLMAKGLKQAYLPNLKRPANRIARYYRLAGDNKNAELYQTIAQSIDPFQSLKMQIEILKIPPISIMTKGMLLDLMFDIGDLDYGLVYPNEAYNVFSYMLELAYELKSDVDIGRAHYLLGSCAWALDDFNGARQHLYQGLEILTKLDKQGSIAGCLQGLGNVAQSQENYDEAREYFQQGLKIFTNLGMERGIANCLSGLGEIAENLGDYNQSLLHFQLALEINTKLGRQGGIANCLYRLGEIAENQENYDQGHQYFMQALEIFTTLGRQRNIAASLYELGEIAKNQEDHDQAIQHFQRALEINTRLGRQRGIAACLEELGKIAENQEDYDQARLFLQQALKINTKLNRQSKITICEQILKKIPNDDKAKTMKKIQENALPVSEPTLENVDSEQQNKTYNPFTVNGSVDNATIIAGNDNLIVSGKANIAIGNAGPVTQSMSETADELAKAFATILQVTQAVPQGPDKVVAQQAVHELEAEARKGDHPDEASVNRWLAFLLETAGDAWKVAVDTLTNPIKGISTAFRLIIVKAREERQRKERQTPQ